MNNIIIKTFSRDISSILSALSDVACTDADVTGENGEEYLWDCAKKQGAESNLDYLVSLAEKDLKEVEESTNYLDDTSIYNAIDNFFNIWLDHDGGYSDFIWDMTFVDGTDKLVIAVFPIFV